MFSSLKLPEKFEFVYQDRISGNIKIKIYPMSWISSKYSTPVYPLPYVTTYQSLSNLFDDGHQGLLIIISFLAVADWSIRHCINVKVSRTLLRTVDISIDTPP